MHFLPKLLCIVFMAALAIVSAQEGNETVSTAAPADPADTNAPEANADEPVTTSSTAAPVEEETTADPEAGMIDNGNATSENSTANDTDTTDEPGTTSTTTTTVTTTAPATPKGVSTACLELYQNCTQEKAADLISDKKYCDALNAAKPCIASENENNTQCTTDELDRLALLDCGPVTLFQNSSVSDACLARVSECLSTAQSVSKLTLDYTFGKFFCDVADNSESCLTTDQAGSKCTSEEHDTLLKAAECNSARALVGSTVLIALLCLMQRVFGGN